MNGGLLELRPAEALSLLPQGLLGQMYLWGIEVIKVIQRVENPVLTALVKFITLLGTEYLYVPLILFIFWWVDEKRGFRLGIFIILSAWINAFLKDLWALPRPFNLDASLGLAFEPTYGAPSGHAQNSLCFWIPMAVWLQGRQRRPRLLWTGVAVLLLLIGFSRLYLGVHFPTDLFAGWIIALLLLAGIWFFHRQVLERITGRLGSRFYNITAAGLTLVMNSLYPAGTYLSALFLGLCLGYTLMKERFPFSTRENLHGKKSGILVMIQRCLMGFGGMVIIYFLLRLILPGEGSLLRDIPLWGSSSPYYELGRFFRYGLLGFWVSAGAPLLFQRMRLSLTEGPGDNKSSEGS